MPSLNPVIDDDEDPELFSEEEFAEDTSAALKSMFEEGVGVPVAELNEQIDEMSEDPPPAETAELPEEPQDGAELKETVKEVVEEEAKELDVTLGEDGASLNVEEREQRTDMAKAIAADTGVLDEIVRQVQTRSEPFDKQLHNEGQVMDTDNLVRNTYRVEYDDLDTRNPALRGDM